MRDAEPSGTSVSDDATARVPTAVQVLGGAIESLGGRQDRLEADQKAALERLDRLEAARNKSRADVMECIARVQNAATQPRTIMP